MTRVSTRADGRENYESFGIVRKFRTAYRRFRASACRSAKFLTAHPSRALPSRRGTPRLGTAGRLVSPPPIERNIALASDSYMHRRCSVRFQRYSVAHFRPTVNSSETLWCVSSGLFPSLRASADPVGVFPGSFGAEPRRFLGSLVLRSCWPLGNMGALVGSVS